MLAQSGVTAADGLRRFLSDPKESGELLMVVDEELKMMARVCAGGGRVEGPRLRMMSRRPRCRPGRSDPTRACPPSGAGRATPARRRPGWPGGAW